MKKITILFTALLTVLALVLGVFALNGEAENSSEADVASESSIPENALITYGYLQQFKEELKQEIIEELAASGGITVEAAYNDISLTEGQTLILFPESEIIYRGGGAIVITSSNLEGEGITDMSFGHELFSGASLEYGHIYYASESDSKKAILVTGTTAYFTVRGEYDIG